MQPKRAQALTQSDEREKKKKRLRIFWICMIIALIAIVIACVLFFTMCGGRSARQGTAGQLEGKTPEELQEELDRIIEEGMFNISIANYVEMENGDSDADLRIENVPNNPYLMKVTITRNDTNEVIYHTDIIEPNFHIQSDKLDVKLPEGMYECTALFTALNKDTEAVEGQAAAIMHIRVLS